MASTSTFRPRARLMLLLGDQLIRDAGIAVFELVKNAYDADATTCEVTLFSVNEESEESRIVVQDDGHGMDINTVRNIWLEPGTEHRKKQKILGQRTKEFDRLPLGEKGVGRFAVHKLGRQVKLITRSKGKDEVVVEIDWSSFDQEQYLSDVPVTVSTRSPKVFKGSQTGTRIEIESLNEMPWTRGRVRSLHRAINSICSPSLAPDSFTPSLKLEPELDWLEGLLSAEDVLKQAIFTFDGTISGDTIQYSYSFKPGKDLNGVSARKVAKTTVVMQGEFINDESGRKENRRIDLDKHRIGDVRVTFHIFDREPRVLKLTSTDVVGLKSYLDNNGGVLVYRDGVRVYDYGEPGNDWLDLGGRRVNVPTKRIGNNQIIGAVQLDLDASQGLVEKTNREGFVENDAYREFHHAIRFAIKQAENERNLDKDRIRTAFAGTKRMEPVLDDLSQLRDEIKERKLEKDLGPYISRIEVQFRDVLQRLLVAAGAGLNLAVVLHEVEKRIADLLQAVESGEKQESLLVRTKALSDMVDGLTWLTRSSGPTVVKASVLINQAILNWKFRFKHHKITVINGMEDDDPDFSIKCNRRLIMGALMNLIDNAIYWLGTRDSGRKLYLGTTYEPNEKPGLLIADNGPGFIDPPEYVVEPFVTRKPDGMGLGLHIANEIMKQEKGRLVFPDPGDVTLPREFSGAVLFMEFEKEI
jgi:signal transduction histidine kinase